LVRNLVGLQDLFGEPQDSCVNKRWILIVYYEKAPIRTKAFTLVELLVVIAIIAMLMAILMPALSKVRDQAKAIMCESKLRQWGLYFSMYTSDNNGYFSEGRPVAGGHCAWLGGSPLTTDEPPTIEGDFVNSNQMTMKRYCLNRHSECVNAVFLDTSVRKVGLKELWTLRWSRSFEQQGPWTLAGGVKKSDWEKKAPWMKNFKDY